MTDDKFTVQAAVDGKLQLSDLRMDPATLAHQAVVAEDGGNPQLAENFLRAAELATIDGEEVMSLYEALRPHRSTAEELEALRASLEARGAARCAELVRQAARRVCPSRSSALIVAGIDVGNHTTEIVLARVLRRRGRTDCARAGADARPERFPRIVGGSGGAAAQAGGRGHRCRRRTRVVHSPAGGYVDGTPAARVVAALAGTQPA